jgi:hypothetical protein
LERWPFLPKNSSDNSANNSKNSNYQRRLCNTPAGRTGRLPCRSHNPEILKVAQNISIKAPEMSGKAPEMSGSIHRPRERERERESVNPDFHQDAPMEHI